MTERRKRLFFFAFLIIAIIFLLWYFFYHHSNRGQKDRLLWGGAIPNPAVFFIPHPDDETLNMGVAVANLVEGGRPTYLILLTHGRTTRALDAINKSLRSQRKYNTLPLLTRDDIEKVRINEFRRASEALGVPNRHIFIEYLDKNTGGMQYNLTKLTMRKYVEMFPNADFYALSWIDVQRDHKISGQVLRDLHEEGVLSGESKVHFLVSMATKMFLEKHKRNVPGSKIRAISYPVENKLRNAMRAYRVWDPKKGLYAVGYNSVCGQFRKFNKELYHYVHGIKL